MQLLDKKLFIIFLSLFVQKNMFVHYRAEGHIETAYYIMFIVCASAYLFAWISGSGAKPSNNPAYFLQSISHEKHRAHKHTRAAIEEGLLICAKFFRYHQ